MSDLWHLYLGAHEMDLNPDVIARWTYSTPPPTPRGRTKSVLQGLISTLNPKPLCQFNSQRVKDGVKKHQQDVCLLREIIKFFFSCLKSLIYYCERHEEVCCLLNLENGGTKISLETFI